jgi:hypothetical protein
MTWTLLLSDGNPDRRDVRPQRPVTVTCCSGRAHPAESPFALDSSTHSKEWEDRPNRNGQ